MTHRIPEIGKVSWDPEENTFYFRCPNCHDTGPLDDHTVTVFKQRVTVEPEIVCECGQFFWFKDNILSVP